MIGQYLPQTNESATVPKTFQFSELNKALVRIVIMQRAQVVFRPVNSTCATVKDEAYYSTLRGRERPKEKVL